MSDTSLVFNVLARDRASKVFRKIRDEANDTGRTLRMALGPAIGPILAASTAGVVGLGAALAGVGASAGVFGAVFKTTFTEVSDASKKTDELRDKMDLLGQQAKIAPTADMRGKYLKQQAAAAQELQARLNALPPTTRQATMAYDGLKTAWKGFVEQNKPATFGVMTGGFRLLTSIIPKLQPLFDTASGAVSRLMASLTSWSGGGGVDRLVAFLNGNAGPAFDNLLRIGRNVATTLGSVFTTFAPTGQGFLDWLADASDKMAAWSSGNGLQKFMKYATDNGPTVVNTLTNLATAAVNIAKAVSPLAPVSMAIATALAAILAALPPGVITTLVAAWLAYSVAMKGYYAWTVIVGAATKAWAAIQWLLNVAMTANPIGLIVAGIIILIGIIVLVATKTKFFQTIWAWVWGFLKKVGAWFAGPFAGFFVRAWNTIVAKAKAAWQWIKDKASAFVDWIKGVPKKVSDKLSSMWGGLKSGFKTAVNWVIGKWNSLHFSIPSFSVLGHTFGGGSIGVPNIPYLAKGGTIDRPGMAVVGEAGPELVSLSKGAQVTPLRRTTAGGGREVLQLEVVGDREVAAFLRRMIRTANLLQT